MLKQFLTHTIRSRVVSETMKRASSLYATYRLPAPPNLLGDRDVEYAWLASHIPHGQGSALDFGCGGGALGLIAAQSGFDTLAIDLTPVRWHYKHSKLRFLQADLLQTSIPAGSLDLVISCSVFEHVGLSRYGDQQDPNGDLKALTRINDLLKPGGLLVCTIPVGIDDVCGVYHRIYGHQRLPRLFEGYHIEVDAYFVKDDNNLWIEASREMALGFRGSPTVYAIGAFAARKGN